MKRTVVITTTVQYWQHAQASGSYARSTIDTTLEEAGFMHATFPHQTLAMLDRHFMNRGDVLLLFVDIDKIRSPLKYESDASGRSGPFPHIYGPLNIGAVYTAVKPEQNEDGTFRPPQLLLDVFNQSFIYNIALVPSSDIFSRAIALSQQVQGKGSTFQLGVQGPYPHVSVYNMVKMRVADAETLPSVLRDVASASQPFSLRASRFLQSFGYLDVEYGRTNSIEHFQMAVINAVNPLRNGLRTKEEEQLKGASGLFRENIEKYGYRSVGKLFRPHMTFTWFAEGQQVNIDGLPPKDRFSGSFDTVGVFEFGEHGKCTRKIFEFKLGEAV